MHWLRKFFIILIITNIYAERFSLQVGPSAYVEIDKYLVEHVNKIIDLKKEIDKAEKASKEDRPISLNTFKAIGQVFDSLDKLDKQPTQLTIQGDMVKLDLKLKKNLSISLDNLYIIDGTIDIDLENLNFGDTIELDDLIGKYHVSTSTPAELEDESLKLTEILQTIGTETLKEAGIDVGNYTLSDVANALLNASLAPGEYGLGFSTMSTTSVSEAVNTLYGVKDPMKRVLNLAKGGTTTEHNQTKLKFSAAHLSRLSLNYTREIKKIKNLFWGVTLRLINAQVFYYPLRVIEGERQVDLTKHRKNSMGISLDAFLKYRKKLWILLTESGLLFSNINSPRFDVPEIAKADGLSFKLYPRVGLFGRVDLRRFLTLKAYLDCIKHKQLWGVKERQYIDFALELKPIYGRFFGILISANAKRNIASADPWLLGLGLGMRLLIFDFNLQAGMERMQKFLDYELPLKANVNVKFGISF